MKIVYLKPLKRLLFDALNFSKGYFKGLLLYKKDLVTLTPVSGSLKLKCAFSLVEMLMALLVASLLMAALAPVMTKKMNENISVSGVGGILIPKVYCAYVNDGNEPLIKDTEDACIVPDDTYNAGIIIASGGGGGGGAADMVSSSSLKNLVTSTGGTGSNRDDNFNIETKTFDKSTKSLLVKIASGGAGGGGGNYYLAVDFDEPKSQADCGDWGVFVSASQNGGKAVCVSRRNPEYDSDGKAAPNSHVSGVINVTAGTTCSGGTCCWRGTTSSPCEEPKNGMTYSGCGRMVCQWNAADAICRNWRPTGNVSGRLPINAELNAWIPHIKHINSTTSGVLNRPNGDFPGLQLCDYASGYGAIQCASSRTCHGADSGGACFPKFIWSGSTGYRGLWLEGGIDITTKVEKYTYTNIYAFGVRCILEEVKTFTPYIGGGGGSGSYLELNIPSNVISEAAKNNNAKIVTYAGYGGKGGSKENASSRGIKGSPSKVEIYDGTNLIWSLTVPGGNPGESASKNSGGTNGKAVDSNCVYFDKTNSNYNITGGVSLACNLLPLDIITSVSGKAGITGKVDNNSENTTAINNPGYGGLSTWATSSGTSMIGKGGNGNTCTQGEDISNITCTDGESGEGGRVEVWHSPTYSGVGGGGGAAGTVLQIKNIQVRPNDLIKVQVGNGGAGGSINAKGADGGSSYIHIFRGENSVAKYEVLGGGGGTPGISGDPDTGKLPEAGKAGSGSKIASGTKTDGGEYFPKNSNDTKGEDAKLSTDEETSAGGNGGINSKISPLVSNDGTSSSIPCGGLNTGEIKVNKDTIWQCTNSTSNIPFILTRVLSDRLFNPDIIQNLAPGSTGGGGGGWKYSATPRASGGAKGMGGYVYIYFGDWREE